MAPEMEHKYHTESKESVKTCTKVKTASTPPPVYTKETMTASKPYSKPYSVCPKSKPSMSVSTATVYTTATKTYVASTCTHAHEDKHEDKPCSCKKPKEEKHEKPCPCKHEDKHEEKPCSCKKPKEEKPKEEKPKQEKPKQEKPKKHEENKCHGSLSKGFEVCLFLRSSPHHPRHVR